MITIFDLTLYIYIRVIQAEHSLNVLVLGDAYTYLFCKSIRHLYINGIYWKYFNVLEFQQQGRDTRKTISVHR